MAKKDKPKRKDDAVPGASAPSKPSKKEQRAAHAAALEARVDALETRLAALTRVFDEALQPAAADRTLAPAPTRKPATASAPAQKPAPTASPADGLRPGPARAPRPSAKPRPAPPSADGAA